MGFFDAIFIVGISCDVAHDDPSSSGRFTGPVVLLGLRCLVPR